MTDHHDTHAPPQPETQVQVTRTPDAPGYVLGPAILRNLFLVSSALGALLVIAILLVATSRPQGRLTPADESQHQATLQQAAEVLEGAAPNEGGETARIPIDQAIALVAEQGLEATMEALTVQNQAQETTQEPVAPAPEAEQPAEEPAAPAQTQTADEETPAVQDEQALQPPTAEQSEPTQDEPASAAVAPPADAAERLNPFADDPEAVQEGEAIAVRLVCTSCHNADYSGAIGPSLIDDEWTYGGDDASLFETLTAGRPGGMPGYEAQTTEDERWQLVSFIQSLSQGN